MTEQVPDLQLVRQVAAIVEHPRVKPPDSFVLHAPLELLARHLLLPHVGGHHRAAARERLAELGARYDAAGPSVPAPPARAFTDPGAAAAHLLLVVDRGELDEVDATAGWLGTHAEGADLARLLGDALAPKLGAAGHAPILLAHLPRLGAEPELTGRLLRPLARALARAPEAHIGWIDRRPAAAPTGDGALLDALGRVHSGPRPAVDFVEPTMRLVDHEVTAAELGPHLGASAEERDQRVREILRAASWTMVEEPGEHAPYGWSHCLTLPQAVLALLPYTATPDRLLAVAATHVVGFRSAFATAPLRRTTPGPDPRLDLTEARAAGPTVAAAAAWHTPPEARASLIGHLVDTAAAHPDAHLVKYTLACLRAAATDPAEARLHLAAAASLSAWWAAEDT